MYYNEELTVKACSDDPSLIFDLINEDYKVFLHATEQENEDTGKKYTSYGLPWRITIEDGKFIYEVPASELSGIKTVKGFVFESIATAKALMNHGGYTAE